MSDSEGKTEYQMSFSIHLRGLKSFQPGYQHFGTCLHYGSENYYYFYFIFLERDIGYEAACTGTISLNWREMQFGFVGVKVFWKAFGFMNDTECKSWNIIQ